jgi:cobalt/nickel transport protein
MQQTTSALILLLLSWLSPSPANAHFGMVIPKQNTVTPDNRSVSLTLSFSHPFEGIGMPLKKPSAFYVVKDNKKTDLTNSLKKITLMEHLAWQTNYVVKRPGIYHFVMEPTPYWEPTEDRFIIHYTKVIVPAFGADDGWSSAVGTPVEIVPLLRPFGNYTGNTFVGQVQQHGKAMANAAVEVEFYNQQQRYRAASDYHITQLVHADNNGIFTFTCTKPGWWGFAALSSADYLLKNKGGEEKPVELGAVLWIFMDSPPDPI